MIRVQVKAAENVEEAKLKELVLSKVNFVILIWLELGLIVEHTSIANSKYEVSLTLLSCYTMQATE